MLDVGLPVTLSGDVSDARKTQFVCVVVATQLAIARFGLTRTSRPRTFDITRWPSGHGYRRSQLDQNRQREPHGSDYENDCKH